ncbi:hypothetical protein FA15DRAFT_665353 [Coprinopsis marcescibilis]|uniref:Uncharacterized protein n=1 Tax=Coprinopsis marcescibilis TaxID=230819 RepID=A0A5C3L8L1_COPMA|nr:hypothetical protein FA15DRAFT_665353 [Coprinopsis marcescibilis]
MKLSVGSVLLACALSSLALPLTQDADASLDAREIDISLEGEHLVSREYEEALAAHYARFALDEEDIEERDLFDEDVVELDARNDIDELDLLGARDLNEFEELELEARDLEALSELSDLERRALLRKLVGPVRRVIAAIRPGAKKPSGSGKKPGKSGKGGSPAKPKKRSSSGKPSKKSAVGKKGSKGSGSKGGSNNKKSNKKDGKTKKKDQGKNGKGKGKGKGGKGKGKGGKGGKPKKKRAIRNLNLNLDPASFVAAGAGVANVLLG